MSIGLKVCEEALLSTDDVTPALFSWDLKTGSWLQNPLKGGATCRPGGIACGNGFILTATPKAVLNVFPPGGWPRLTLPSGQATALAVSPDAGTKMVAVATSEEVRVWQTSSGKLMGVMSGGHFQAVTNLKFTDDLAFVVSGAKDGNVVLWSTLEMTSDLEAKTVKPFKTFNLHSLEITGMQVVGDRIFTCSSDQTAKVTDFESGVILDVSFTAPLTSIFADRDEVHVGSSAGKIFCFSLADPPRGLTQSLNPGQGNTFEGGHKSGAAITCLARSVDRSKIVSGADDGNVVVWDARTRIPIRTLAHKGPITNLLIVPNFTSASRPFSVLCPFEKTKQTNGAEVQFFTREEVPSLFDFNEEDAGAVRASVDQSGRKSQNVVRDDEEVAKLKEINLELYQQALKHVLLK